MIDTGRRFVPKSDVLNSLAAMSYSKMNVLHLHLSDDQRCAVQSTTYPNLTAHLTGSELSLIFRQNLALVDGGASDRMIAAVKRACV